MSSSMGVVVSVKGAAAEKILKAVKCSADPRKVENDARIAKTLMDMLNKK